MWNKQVGNLEKDKHQSGYEERHVNHVDNIDIQRFWRQKTEETHELLMSSIHTQAPLKLSVTNYEQTLLYTYTVSNECK